MIEVCCVVDDDRSPMSASAPVLKMPMATPDSPISAAKNRNDSPAVNRKQAAAKSVRPAMIVARRPSRSASEPRNSAEIAMPPIVAYWKLPAGGQREIEGLDDLRNDDADRVGRHREHREHRVGQRLDDGEGAAVRRDRCHATLGQALVVVTVVTWVPPRGQHSSLGSVPLSEHVTTARIGSEVDLEPCEIGLRLPSGGQARAPARRRSRTVPGKPGGCCGGAGARAEP